MVRIVSCHKFSAIAILMAIAFIGLLVYFLYLPADKDDGNLTEITVRQGDGLRVVADKLSNAGLIRNKFLFVAYVSLKGQDDELKAGRYLFSRSMSIPVILSLITEGKSESDDTVVVIPEGLNVWEIDKLLVKKGLISEGQFSLQFYDEEGYLYPDTYRLRNFQFPISNLQINSSDQNSKQEETVEKLREKMKENFNNKTNKLWKNLSLEKRKKILVIASILEKEAKTEEDMQLVAGIIYKRLELDIPLQIDATVIYGACLRNFQFPISNLQKIKNCDVTFQSPAEEIKIDGPYNTYIREGLPPAPISNPGLKAIQAALNPQESDYLYYLSTRDGSQMIYSKTSAEHAGNRRKYLGL